MAEMREHEKRLQEAQVAREERRRRIRERDREARKAEAVENISLHAIDSVFDHLAPIVKSIFTRQELQKRTDRE